MASPAPTASTTSPSLVSISSTTFFAYVAGLISALLTSILISHRDAVERLADRAARAALWVWAKVGRSISTATANVKVLMDTDADEVKKRVNTGDREEVHAKKERTEQLKKDNRSAVERKPFEFRKRLWNEPPEGQDLEGDYVWYECLDAVQKEFKDAGGKDIEWKTNWLDLWAERWLLGDYQSWVDEEKRSKELSEKERAFYQGLYDNLEIDWSDVYKEDVENTERHG